MTSDARSTAELITKRVSTHLPAPGRGNGTDPTDLASMEASSKFTALAAETPAGRAPVRLLRRTLYRVLYPLLKQQTDHAESLARLVTQLASRVNVLERQASAIGSQETAVPGLSMLVSEGAFRGSGRADQGASTPVRRAVHPPSGAGRRLRTRRVPGASTGGGDRRGRGRSRRRHGRALSVARSFCHSGRRTRAPALARAGVARWHLLCTADRAPALGGGRLVRVAGGAGAPARRSPRRGDHQSVVIRGTVELLHRPDPRQAL